MIPSRVNPVPKASGVIAASWGLRQNREISRIPVAEIRDIPWSHYDYVKSCFPPMPYVSLFLQDIRLLYAWEYVMRRNRHTGCYQCLLSLRTFRICPIYS